MYSADHGARVSFPLNAGAMIVEPSSMLECVQAMKEHIDGFTIALNSLMKNLDNEDDLMLALDVADQEGGEIWKKTNQT